MTAFGSLGLPSLPISFLPNLSSTYSLLASSNVTLRSFMILLTSSLPCSSRPCLASPPSILSARSKFELDSPASASSRKEPGTGVYRVEWKDEERREIRLKSQSGTGPGAVR